MIILLLIVFGLIFGSFVNALVWRFHEQAVIRDRQGAKHKPGKAGKHQAEALDSRLAALSMLKGRSMCSSCGHELAAKDLLPLFSWLYLRGRCRYCGVKIQDSPLVEVALTLVFIVSYVWWPLSLHGVGLFQFIVWLGFVVAFVALAVYDLRWWLLPDRMVYPLIGLAVGQVIVVAAWQHSSAVALNAALGSLIIYGIFYLLFQLSNGNWIGGGDVKLSVVLGLLAGTPLKALLVIFFASLIGTIASIPALVQGKQGLQMKIPFGPFLLMATGFVVLFGGAITDWYRGLLR